MGTESRIPIQSVVGETRRDGPLKNPLTLLQSSEGHLLTQALTFNRPKVTNDYCRGVVNCWEQILRAIRVNISG